MKNHNIIPDPDLSAEQTNAVEALSENEIKAIDLLLLRNTSDRWSKVSFIVGSVMKHNENLYKGIPDLYFAQRVRKLVADGTLESQGFLESMRYCEVRRVH